MTSHHSLRHTLARLLLIALLCLLLSACGSVWPTAQQRAETVLPTTPAAIPVPTASLEPQPDSSVQDTPADETPVTGRAPEALKPDPTLSPQEVVQIQAEALQNNDEPEPDSGIRTTFQFASPANRELTGPIDNFIELVQNPEYRDLLNSREIIYGDTEIDGSTALQPVIIVSAEGETVFYLFTLSKQTEAPYEDCWMTDGVLRLEPPEPEAEEI